MKVKRILACAVALALTTGAAFAQMDREEFTATVEFTQEGSVSMTAQLRNLFGEGNPEQISWNPDHIDLGETAWMRAEQSIELNASITHASGGIQIYTDNQAIYGGNGNPAGLVMEQDNTRTLPMAWRIAWEPLGNEDEMPGAVNWDNSELNIIEFMTPDHHLGVAAHHPDSVGGEDGYYPVFLWMKDLNTPDIPEENAEAFVPGEDYVTLRDGRGIQHAADTFGAAASPNYIYIGANFLNAATPAKYEADKVVVEAFIE